MRDLDKSLGYYPQKDRIYGNHAGLSWTGKDVAAPCRKVEATTVIASKARQSSGFEPGSELRVCIKVRALLRSLPYPYRCRSARRCQREAVSTGYTDCSSCRDVSRIPDAERP